MVEVRVEIGSVNEIQNQLNSVLIRRIRVRKEDSAYIYAILESHEGVASYSTLDHEPGRGFRDLELQVPTSQALDLERVLAELEKDGIEIHRLQVV